MKYQSAYSHDKTVLDLVPMSIDELKALRRGDIVYFLHTLPKYPLDALSSLVYRRAKVNGKPQTWKTRPNDVRVPMKYGMYEHWQSIYCNGILIEGTTLYKEAPHDN